MPLIYIHVFQFLFEGMEESGSEGLDDMVYAQRDAFLKVSICQISDILMLD